jgi:eukaryotic-like serine/threonine-protein kinase
VQTPGEQQPSAGGQGGGTDDVGRVLAGRYRVIGRLGRGGMGIVWRAADEVLGREVALKELRTYTDAGSAELDDLRTRMQREARAAARVRHPGVISVHDVAQHEGRPVIVMELVEGPSLDDVLRERGSLEPREAAAIGAKVMDALAAAHQVGVLHRDVKPGNVLLENGGERVVLTDFGIASMEDPEDGASTHLTGSGELVGSLDYLAPERARGEKPRPASDVWALGATLYAAIEGAAPFRRTSTWSTLNAIVVDPLPEPQRAGTLAPVLAELMDKDPEKRVDAVRAAALLRAVADGTAPPSVSDTVRLGRTEGQAATAPSSGPEAPQTPVASASPHEPTVRSAAHPGAPAGVGQSAQPGQHPGGQAPFGTPPVPPGALDPYAGNGPHGGPGTDGQTAGTPGARTPGRRRAVIAAAVAAVVLAGTGVTYGVMAQGEDEGARAAKSSGDGASSGAKGENAGKASGQSGGSEPASSGRGSDSKPGAAAGGSSGGKDDNGGKDGGGATNAGSGSDGGGSTDGGGSSAGNGSSESEPPTSCHSRDGGKTDCILWKTATSYDAKHKPVGRLLSGVNYFYCQAKLSHRETSGPWTNVWWAKTDDDSGNSDVFVSVVYVKGGNSNEPVPGLPIC